VVSIIASLLEAQLMLLSAFGLLGILDGFTHGSKVFTPKLLSILKITSVSLHVGLVGPTYFLLAFYNIPYPFSTRVSLILIQLILVLYQVYFFSTFAYMIWQYGYMAFYIQKFRDAIRIDDPSQPSSKQKLFSLRNSFIIIAVTIVVSLSGCIIWTSTWSGNTLQAHFLNRICASYMGAVNTGGVLLFMEFKLATNRITRLISTSESIN
jgi:hypothetical protein